jgi:hypothetical protein
MATGSGIDSYDILGLIDHPDKSTGSASPSEHETYTVNALGQNVTYQDQNVPVHTVHTYTYDVVGRFTSDAVTTIGSGVDGAVRRIEVGYDGQGNAALFTSFNLPSAGVPLNQVQRVFNGLGQLTVEYQEHAGAVNSGTTLNVQYAYSFSEMAGAPNHSRLISMTYPRSWIGVIQSYIAATHRINVKGPAPACWAPAT